MNKKKVEYQIEALKGKVNYLKRVLSNSWNNSELVYWEYRKQIDELENQIKELELKGV